MDVQEAQEGSLTSLPCLLHSCPEIHGSGFETVLPPHDSPATQKIIDNLIKKYKHSSGQSSSRAPSHVKPAPHPLFGEFSKVQVKVPPQKGGNAFHAP